MAELKEAQAAAELFRGPDFRRLVRELHESCPWATAYQSWAFVSTWYNCYEDSFEPVILFEIADDGRLAGLLTLARSRTDSRLVVAGDHQAEYQCWLSLPEQGDRFICAALETLREAYGNRTLAFKFLPPNAPVAWSRDLAPWRQLVRLRSHRRPLIELKQAEGPHQWLTKKRYKSRINRLRKNGDFEFRILESAEALEGLIDEIADQYDFRQGAANGVSPFREDPKKRAFHMALMRNPDLLHASVLTFDGTVLAANLGVKEANGVSMGVFSSGHLFANQSPGRLFIIFLGAALARHGMDYLDLTPGGAWKEQLANAHDEVLEARVFFSGLKAWRAGAADSVAGLARRSLAALGLSTQDARRLAGRFRKPDPVRAIRSARAALWENREYRIYMRDAAAAPRPEPEGGFARDRVSDLLAFEASEPGQAREAFLTECHRRLAEGQHVYTRLERGRLVHYGWLAEGLGQEHFPEVEQSFTYPEKTAVLHGHYTLPEARGRGLYRQCIQAMLKDAAESPAAHVGIAVRADNAAARNVIETLGFRYDTSLGLARRLGAVRRWAERPDPRASNETTV